MSQEDVSRASGVSQQRVSQIEAGAHIHYGGAVAKIAAALDVSVTDILDAAQCDDAALLDRKSLVALWLGLDPQDPATAPYLDHVREALAVAG
jgi:transcriptional regulator with XRE-family HTH domain